MSQRGAAGTPWWQQRSLRVAISLVLILAAAVTFVLGRQGKSSAAPNEIARQSADAPGTNTFTPSVAAPKPATTAPTVTTSPPPSTAGLTRADASVPGLYAGTRGVPSCNATQLVTYLETNPVRGRAWAEAIGIPPQDIKAFVATLTPAITRVDTRVTDYRFADGKPQPRQSIVQAGTAVLLDRSAFPRVRCMSGDPLGQPHSVSGTPSYTGPSWPGFSPTTIVVINPSPPPAPIILIDFGNGTIFARIPGSIVIIDIDRPAEGVTIIVVEPGGPFRVSGSLWPPGTALTITFDNPAVTLATPTADGGGNFSVEVTCPPAATPGVHTVTIAGGGTTVTQPVYVVPPAPRATRV